MHCELPIFVQVDDGLIHFSLLRPCVSTQVPLHLCGTLHDRTALPHALTVVEAILSALGMYAGFEGGFKVVIGYADSHIQYCLLIRQKRFAVSIGRPNAVSCRHSVLIQRPASACCLQMLQHAATVTECWMPARSR